MTFVSNARMYAVSPEAEADWKDLIARVAGDAGASLEYLAYKAPQPLEDLWRRADLGCVQMCGYPYRARHCRCRAAGVARARRALGRGKGGLPDRPDRPEGCALRGSRRHLRRRGRLDRRALAFGLQRAAPSSSSLAQRRPAAALPASPSAISSRRGASSKAWLDGTVDVGPLDAYWHMLMRKYRARD